MINQKDNEKVYSPDEQPFAMRFFVEIVMQNAKC